MNHRKFNHAFQTVCDMVAVICQYKNQEIVKICEKNPPKWQKHDLVSGGHGRAAKLGACVNWVDWLRTSADKRMRSGRRAVVMRTGRRAELLGVKLGLPRSRCCAIVSDVLCVRSYVERETVFIT